jgi:hypothetical protein
MHHAAREFVALLARIADDPCAARRVRPNHATFRTLVAVLRQQGDLAGALHAYEVMRRRYPADNCEFEGLTAVAGGERAGPCTQLLAAPGCVRVGNQRLAWLSAILRCCHCAALVVCL